jgi:hypothetical protein
VQPFIPPAVTQFEPFTALAWGLMLAAVPLFFLVVTALMRRKLAFVTALGFVAVTFAAGAFLVSPLDAERQTTATRNSVVSEWLDENYPQYGGAEALLSHFNDGSTFKATADDGKQRTMHFSFSPESGYRLIALTDSKPADVVVKDDRLDVAGQLAEKEAAAQG